jgi:16S rRNA (cytidine1402-2'-O)-methyltransferase
MESNPKPALLLLPNLLGEHQHHSLYLPSSVDKAVSTLDGLIAESASAGLRYLGRFATKKPPNQLPIALYNLHTPDEEIDFLLEPIQKGERWGLVSDAGVPCVADPGSKLVRRARQRGIVVQAFVGPVSWLLALMLSGLPGQCFYFAGYLAKEPSQREKEIKELEKRAKKEHCTQIFIETPFRNRHLLESLLKILDEETYLCIAWELTLPGQGILSQKVGDWKKSPLPNLDKKNAVFLISVY